MLNYHKLLYYDEKKFTKLCDNFVLTKLYILELLIDV